MAEQAPQPDVLELIQRKLGQNSATPEDVSTETSTDPETDPEELEASAEADSEEPDEVETEDSEESDVRTLADLAKRMELGEEELAKHLKLPGRDGQEVSLHDVLTAYRAPQPDAAELTALRAHRQHYEQARALYGQEMEQLRATAQRFAAEMKARQPDLEQLKTTNPGAYATAMLEQVRHERHLEVAARQLEIAHARQAQDREREVNEFRRAEAQKLQRAVPEWQDHTKFAAGLDEISQYLMTTHGLKEEELAGLSDSRDWLVARKAMLYDRLQSKAPSIADKVRKLPPVLKGGGPAVDRGAKAAAAKAETELSERAKKSGNPDDIAALIAHRMKSSERRAAGRTLARGRRS